MREQGRSEVLFPLCPSLPLQLSGHLYFPWLPDRAAKRSTCHRKTIRHPAVTSHSLLWTSHVTSTILLSFSVSLVLLLACSLCLLHVSPPPLCTVWGMVYEQRDSVSHPESWTKTRTYREIFAGCVTLTHRSPTSSSPPPWWFLPNVIVLFYPLRHLFYSHESAVGKGLQFTDMKWNLYTFADMSFHAIHTCIKYILSHT